MTDNEVTQVIATWIRRDPFQQVGIVGLPHICPLQQAAYTYGLEDPAVGKTHLYTPDRTIPLTRRQVTFVGLVDACGFRGLSAREVGRLWRQAGKEYRDG